MILIVPISDDGIDEKKKKKNVKEPTAVSAALAKKKADAHERQLNIIHTKWI